MYSTVLKCPYQNTMWEVAIMQPSHKHISIATYQRPVSIDDGYKTVFVDHISLLRGRNIFTTLKKLKCCLEFNVLCQQI